MFFWRPGLRMLLFPLDSTQLLLFSPEYLCMKCEITRSDAGTLHRNTWVWKQPIKYLLPYCLLNTPVPSAHCGRRNQLKWAYEPIKWSDCAISMNVTVHTAHLNTFQKVTEQLQRCFTSCNCNMKRMSQNSSVKWHLCLLSNTRIRLDFFCNHSPFVSLEQQNYMS